MPETATVDPTPATETATPATAPAAQEPASNGTGTVNGQGSDAAGAAPSEETFFSGDPNSLPPELKQAYTNMLKDYKAKTQSISETRKKAEYYDQIARDKRFVDYWQNGGNAKPSQQKQQEAAAKKLAEVITPEEFQQAFTSQDKFLELLERAVKHTSEGSQKEINQLKQQLSVKDAGDVVESFATQIGKDGQLVRPDFYQLDEDGLITGYLTVNQPEEASEKSYQAKLNEAYSWAKQMTTKYYEKGRQDALARIQQKAATSTEMPTNAVKGAYSGPDPKKLTPSEAFQLAKKGIRVPRDD